MLGTTHWNGWMSLNRHPTVSFYLVTNRFVGPALRCIHVECGGQPTAWVPSVACLALWSGSCAHAKGAENPGSRLVAQQGGVMAQLLLNLALLPGSSCANRVDEIHNMIALVENMVGLFFWSAADQLCMGPFGAPSQGLKGTVVYTYVPHFISQTPTF